jgi:hypothetical protein
LSLSFKWHVHRVQFYSSHRTYHFILFPSIMNICAIIASLVDDGFMEPISGGKGLDSSHFLGFGPGVAQISVGC